MAYAEGLFFDLSVYFFGTRIIVRNFAAITLKEERKGHVRLTLRWLKNFLPKEQLSRK